MVGSRARPPAGEVVFLGAARDRVGADRIIEVLQGEFPQARFSNLCGERDLAASLAELAACEEFRGVDSSLLHYARWLGLRCLSFWGPTDPRTRLRPIPGLVEEAVYRKVACSPCIHVSEEPPCRGRNVCMQRLFQSEKGWSVGAVGQDDSQDLPILVYP